MSTESNKALINRYFAEVINEGKVALIPDLFSPAYVNHGPSAQMSGTDGLKALISSIRGAFPDIQVTIEHLIAEGDLVVTRWTANGTHRNPFMGVPASNARVAFTATIIDRVIDGKIVERWANQDDLGLMRQLGLIASR